MPLKRECIFGEMSVDTWKHSFWKENAKYVCKDEVSLRGKIVIVTGSNSGIGKETVMQIAKRGAVTVMAVRNLEKGIEALEEIKKRLGGTAPVNIELMKIDLGDLQSINDFVAEFQTKYDHLNILINNAAVSDMSGVLQKTRDRFEQHLGVNFLGPFLLTNLLIPLLKKGSEAGSPSRVVNVQSTALLTANLDLGDLAPDAELHTEEYNTMQYAISKLLSALTTRRLVRELELLEGEEMTKQVKFFQLCPGHVKTRLSQDFSAGLSGISRSVADVIKNTNRITPHQGCETTVFLSVSKELASDEKKSGKGEMYRFMQPFESANNALAEFEEKEPHKVDQLFKMAQGFVGLRRRSFVDSI